MLKKVNVNFLKTIILEVNPRSRGREINSKTNLFEERFLDSYSVIQLVNTLEERVGITFDYADLKAAYFRNLDSLLALLVQKYGLQVAPDKKGKKKTGKKTEKKT